MVFWHKCTHVELDVTDLRRAQRCPCFKETSDGISTSQKDRSPTETSVIHTHYDAESFWGCLLAASHGLHRGRPGGGPITAPSGSLDFARARQAGGGLLTAPPGSLDFARVRQGRVVATF